MTQPKAVTAAEAQKTLAAAPKAPKSMRDLEKMAEEGRDKKDASLAEQQEAARRIANGEADVEQTPATAKPRTKPVGSDPNSQAYNGEKHEVIDDVFSPSPTSVQTHMMVKDGQDVMEVDDKNVDTSDIPELTDEQLKQMTPRQNVPQQPKVVQVTREPTDEELRQKGYAKLTDRQLQTENFIKKRGRVTIDIEGGTFSIPVVGVKQGKFCVAVFTPLDENGIVFVPNPGTQLSLTYNDQVIEAYYPGSYTEITELGIGVMHLIRADDGGKDHGKA